MIGRLRSTLIKRRQRLVVRYFERTLEPGDVTRIQRYSTALDVVVGLEMALSPHWWRLEASVAAARGAATLARMSARLRGRPIDQEHDDD